LPRRERLDGWPQGIRPNQEPGPCLGGRLAFLGLHDELDQLSVRREDEVDDRAERPASPSRREAADGGESPRALAVEVELLPHQDKGRRDGNRVRKDFARREREISVGAVAAEDVEAEDAPQLIVEEDVHDDAEANVGIANGSGFDPACAKTPVHRPVNSPTVEDEN
jgi:hypothetical protein